MSKKVTVEQVKKALQCKQYNASEHFTMDVTGLSHSTLGRIFMLKKADEKKGIVGIYTTGCAAERLRDVVAEALGYSTADREKVKYGAGADDDSGAEPEQLTLDDATRVTNNLVEDLKAANEAMEAMFKKFAECLENLAKLIEEGRDE